MAANIKEVAEKAGVSTATVSHVINGTRYVAEDKKQAVLSVMKQLDYRPNSVARSLRSQKSKIIGLIIPVALPDTSSFFFSTVAQGIQKKLKENGYNLILSNSTEMQQDEMEQIRVFNSQLIDGLIIAPTANDHTYLNDVLNGSYPVVFIDRKPTGYPGDCVLVDGFKASYEAVEQLISKGHKRIAYIGGQLGITTSNERFEGYKKALTDNGVEFDDTIAIHSGFGEATFQNGYSFTKELLEKSSFTALFVTNNVMSMGTMACLQEKGVKIPHDLAVIGFDDYEWAKITVPPLSVIKQPSFELGMKAAEVLLDKINNSSDSYKEYRLDAQLIIRDSF